MNWCSWQDPWASQQATVLTESVGSLRAFPRAVSGRSQSDFGSLESPFWAVSTLPAGLGPPGPTPCRSALRPQQQSQTVQVQRHQPFESGRTPAQHARQPPLLQVVDRRFHRRVCPPRRPDFRGLLALLIRSVPTPFFGRMFGLHSLSRAVPGAIEFPYRAASRRFPLPDALLIPVHDARIRGIIAARRRM